MLTNDPRIDSHLKIACYQLKVLLMANNGDEWNVALHSLCRTVDDTGLPAGLQWMFLSSLAEFTKRVRDIEIASMAELDAEFPDAI